jgi:3-isopropylmalate/(R)-2-methylmalate dehydratase small subunit
MKNGLLPVVLSEAQVTELGRRARDVENYEATVDLEQCSVTDSQGISANFAIEEFQRQCLLEGLDDISLTLQHEAEISAYESRRPTWIR